MGAYVVVVVVVVVTLDVVKKRGEFAALGRADEYK